MHSTISSLINFAKDYPEHAEKMTEQAIESLAKSDQKFREILDSVSADPAYRGVILRAIISHASAKPGEKPASKTTAKEEKESEIERILGFMKGKDWLSRTDILAGAKIEGDTVLRKSVWDAVMSSGKIESNNKPGRGAAYRYKG